MIVDIRPQHASSPNWASLESSGRIVAYPDRAPRAQFGRQEAVAQVARFQSEYPEPLTAIQGLGSIPIRSLTADRIRCLQPRYLSVV
jgi:hypothetical protein